MRERVDAEALDLARPVLLEPPRPEVEVGRTTPRAEDTRSPRSLRTHPRRGLVRRSLEGHAVVVCVAEHADLQVEVRVVAAAYEWSPFAVERDRDLVRRAVPLARARTGPRGGCCAISSSGTSSDGEPLGEPVRDLCRSGERLGVLCGQLGADEQPHRPAACHEPRHSLCCHAERRGAEVADGAVVGDRARERRHVEGRAARRHPCRSPAGGRGREAGRPSRSRRLEHELLGGRRAAPEAARSRGRASGACSQHTRLLPDELVLLAHARDRVQRRLDECDEPLVVAPAGAIEPRLAPPRARPRRRRASARGARRAASPTRARRGRARRRCAAARREERDRSTRRADDLVSLLEVVHVEVERDARACAPRRTGTRPPGSRSRRAGTSR